MRKDREARLREDHPGRWSSMSDEYFQIVGILFQHSSQIAAEGARRSLWVYAGLPLLIAGLEAFLVERQHLFKFAPRLQPVAGIDPLVDVVKSYNVSETLVVAIADLVEVRNEIMHPATLPFDRGKYPDYVNRLLELQLLDCYRVQSGAEILKLLASHRLFEWAVGRCCELLDAVARSDPQRSHTFSQLADNLREVIGSTPPDRVASQP
jgi:hypothetical protein